MNKFQVRTVGPHNVAGSSVVLNPHCLWSASGSSKNLPIDAQREQQRLHDFLSLAIGIVSYYDIIAFGQRESPCVPVISFCP